FAHRAKKHDEQTPSYPMSGDEIPHFFLTAPPSYAAVATGLGQGEQCLLYEKPATSSHPSAGALCAGLSTPLAATHACAVAPGNTRARGWTTRGGAPGAASWRHRLARTHRRA